MTQNLRSLNMTTSLKCCFNIYTLILVDPFPSSALKFSNNQKELKNKSMEKMFNNQR